MGDSRSRLPYHPCIRCVRRSLPRRPLLGKSTSFGVGIWRQWAIVRCPSGPPKVHGHLPEYIFQRLVFGAVGERRPRATSCSLGEGIGSGIAKPVPLRDKASIALDRLPDVGPRSMSGHPHQGCRRVRVVKAAKYLAPDASQLIPGRRRVPDSPAQRGQAVAGVRYECGARQRMNRGDPQRPRFGAVDLAHPTRGKPTSRSSDDPLIIDDNKGPADRGVFFPNSWSNTDPSV